MSVQARIWNSLTSELYADHGKYEQQFNTPRMERLARLYNDLLDQFKSTLTSGQKKALNALVDLSNSVSADMKYSGVAQGLRIAKELKAFLDNPEEAMRESFMGYNPVGKIHGTEKIIIEEYIAEYQEEKQNA